MLNRSVSRTQTSGPNSAREHGEIIRQSSMQGSMPFVQKAVVVDVIVKPDELDDDYKAFLQETVNNYELVEVMPTNSVIARLLSSGQGLVDSQPNTVLFPFFSSHFMLPIQPGELVYVLYEDYQTMGNKLGYWLTRPHGSQTTEDVNYTHIDRMFDTRNNPINWDAGLRDKVNYCPPPNFQNGGGTKDTQTLANIDNKNPYDLYFYKSISGKLVTPEPVPRWNKRPQELVLQGSNNTLIMFGEDRFGHVSGAIDPTANVKNENRVDIKGFSGTVDIIAGRGRKMPKAENKHDTDPVNAAKMEPSRGPTGDSLTDNAKAPRVIQNARGFFETDKAPFRQKSGSTRTQNNPIEGDPDFVNDAARLMISMQTEGDLNFGTTTITYPGNTIPIVQPPAGSATSTNVSGSFNRSYVIGKGDHIRLIARKDTDLEVAGTILLLREGIRGTNQDIKYGGEQTTTSQDEDLAYIFLDEGGRIQIQSKEINLGPTADKQEPYLLHTKYQKSIESLQDQITDMAQKQSQATMQLRAAFEQVITIISTICQGTNVSPGPGQPHPSIAAIGVGVVPILQTLAGQGVLSNHFQSAFNELLNAQSSNISENVAKGKQSTIIYGS